MTLRTALALGGMCVALAATPSIAVSAREPANTLADATAWLRAEAKRMIRASRRSMQSGVAAFPPQVGSWLRRQAPSSAVRLREGPRAGGPKNEPVPGLLDGERKAGYW